ncbi:hypothetical protein OGAPHI_006692 [Ogataea philodendri]|uniref:Uncharacterized protein n=1 Tax=Ogataea philodendri TaxID=1378263 RepID=A0A9P8NXF0_9ASCO|nr:uncharacterized protein OGAPHI_006692 [Ogataea philodendri]KAH3661285.1 hypothetical protein OGAPHI_006692 [Ogataea philodendri]
MDDNFLQEAWSTCLKGVPSQSFEVVSAPLQAVDYFSVALSEEQYFRCWNTISKSKFVKPRELSSVYRLRTLKSHGQVEDIQLILPCTSSQRLQNACWRAWQKQRNKLPELDPAAINWHKENDITALYGPLMGDPEYAVDEDSSDNDDTDDDFSSSRFSSMSSSVSSVDFGKRPNLQPRHRRQRKQKQVSFSESVSRRDIVGDTIFDCTYSMV